MACGWFPGTCRCSKAAASTGRRVTFTQKAAAVGHVDADDGFGHLASFRAIEEGIAMARSSGVAAITVGRSTHHGATGVYTLAAARRGFAAIGMTHADPAVVPFGGTKPFYGTNPISFAVPAPGEEPMLLDMATSSIPYNRIFLRRATGTPLPPEVAVTKDGTPTVDPFAATAVLPLGGAGFGYKGAGLAAMVDILCSAFSGMGHGATIDPLAGSDYGKPIPIGHFFLILMPAMFQAVASLRRAHRRVPGRPPAASRRKPGQKVMAPGDIEKAEAERRARDGIPIDRTTWASLVEAAARYGRRVPPARPTPAVAGGRADERRPGRQAGADRRRRGRARRGHPASARARTAPGRSASTVGRDRAALLRRTTTSRSCWSWSAAAQTACPMRMRIADGAAGFCAHDQAVSRRA